MNSNPNYTVLFSDLLREFGLIFGVDGGRVAPAGQKIAQSRNPQSVVFYFIF